MPLYFWMSKFESNKFLYTQRFHVFLSNIAHKHTDKRWMVQIKDCLSSGLKSLSCSLWGDDRREKKVKNKLNRFA